MLQRDDGAVAAPSPPRYAHRRLLLGLASEFGVNARQVEHADWVPVAVRNGRLGR